MPHSLPEDASLVPYTLLQIIFLLIASYGVLVVYRILSTFEYHLQQRVNQGLRKERRVKQKVLSCIKKSETSRLTGQSNQAHTIPPICDFLIEAFDELERHPEIYEDRKLYDLATVYLMFRAHRIRFMEVTVDKRADWLKEHCTSFKS